MTLDYKQDALVLHNAPTAAKTSVPLTFDNIYVELTGNMHIMLEKGTRKGVHFRGKNVIL